MAGIKSLRIISNFRILSFSIVALAIFLAPALHAQTPTNATFTINPPLSEPAKSHPMLMLTLSGDHQIFLKAYNDFDDLDGDGLPDVTYNHNVVYKGYFNEEKCAVLVLECADKAQAIELLKKSPLVEKNLITFEIIELHPYTSYDRILSTV